MCCRPPPAGRSLHAPIKIILGAGIVGDEGLHADFIGTLEGLITPEPVPADKPVETTLGRAILNTAFPVTFPYIEAVIFKSDVRRLIEEVIDRYGKTEVQEVLDAIKELGFNPRAHAGRDAMSCSRLVSTGLPTSPPEPA